MSAAVDELALPVTCVTNRRVTAAGAVMEHFSADLWPPMVWFKTNVHRFYLTDEQIVSLAGPVTDAWRVAGIYFLVNDGRIVYVGQSKNIGRRIEDHGEAGKIFSGVTWFQAPPFFLDDIEAYYIDRIGPELNVRRQIGIGADDVLAEYQKVRMK